MAGLFWPLWWLIAHLAYRFRVYHTGRVPRSGPVLLVANHVTLWDWLLIRVAVPRRVEFVPVGEMARAKELLAAGKAVVVFAEGHLSRNGQMAPFDPRLAECFSPKLAIIPIYLDNLWETQFSYGDGKLIWKWPRKPFRRHVAVFFSEPMWEPTVPAIRAAIVEAGAWCGIAQSEYLTPAPCAFIHQAASFRHLFRTACVDLATGTERKLTWGKLLVGAWSLTSWLKTKLGPEQNVGLWLPTSLGSSLANVALSFCRRTTVNLNYTAGVDAVNSAIAQAGVKQIITSQRFLDKMPFTPPAGVELIRLEEAMAAIKPFARLWRFMMVLLLPGWVLSRFIFKLHTLKPDDPMTIMFSSGSTGEPKGVVLSMRNITANVDGFRRGVEFHDTDRFMVTLPFFHSFGYTVSLWTTLVVGMEAVYFPDPRAAKEVGEYCKKYRCTILLGTATFLRFYLRRCDAEDFRSLRLLVCGAEKLPVKLAMEFQEKFQIQPYEGYGCTELSPVVGTNIPDVEIDGVKQIANTFGTIGQPVPNVCMKTFDPETLAPLPHGEEGLLGGLGPNVMLGYWQQPEKTAQVLRGGWYISGDVGKIEDDGFIRITGRVSRFAKIAGEMVPLERLDEELHELLGSCGERRLAVAAAPDEKRGERVLVFHVLDVKGQLSELFEKLRKSGIPNLWIPDLRDCHIVEHFPTLGSGKLDLKRLGDWAKAVASGQALPT
ncbi:MAG: AMP-binding protein [Fimbriiglobus sp.]